VRRTRGIKEVKKGGWITVIEIAHTARDFARA
jgi:hypothetical protein